VRWLGACVVVLACRAQPGDPCREGDARCLDGSTALVCDDGKAAATPCKGPRGCRVEGDAMHCDVSGNAEGDRCTTALESEGSCSPDGKALVQCRGGAYAVLPCRGPAGCRADAERAVCDRSIAAEGEACAASATATPCDASGKALLRCAGGKLVRAAACLGPMGCAVRAEGVVCDERVATAGSGCAEGARACAEDGKSLLVCRSGKLAVERRCDGPGGCIVHDDPQRDGHRAVDPATVVCDP
jgi:hypothetical protein